jgi:PAS domain S-box-containing protein
MAKKRTNLKSKRSLPVSSGLSFLKELDPTIDALVDPVLVYNSKGIIVKANHSALKLSAGDLEGLNQKEVIRRLNICLPGKHKITPGSLPSAQAIKGKVVKGKRLVVDDLKGNEHVLSISASPVWEAGKVTGAIVIWRDITENLKAERALKYTNRLIEQEVRKQTEKINKANFALEIEIKKRIASQEILENSYGLLEKIFASTTFLIAYLDTNADIIRVNEAFAQIEGKDPAYFIGKNLFDLFPSEEHKAYMREVIKSGESYTFYEKEFEYAFHPERGVTYWDCNLHPVKDSSGRVEGLIMFLVDRTKMHMAREQLVLKEKELSDSKRLQEIGRLSAIVAHELRNPLGAIRAAAYNIKLKAGSPKIESNLANIETKVIESEQIISNLLSYSRIKLPRFEPVKIAFLLNECLDTALERFNKKKISLTRDIEEIKDEKIWADPLQLKEVCHNILDNAFDACSEEKGNITLIGKKEGGDSIVVSFQDNGEGMNEDLLKRIFEPFFTTKSKGTGLGLAVCKQVVDLHGGNIVVKSKPGAGSTFAVTLPIRKELFAKTQD